MSHVSGDPQKVRNSWWNINSTEQQWFLIWNHQLLNRLRLITMENNNLKTEGDILQI